MVSIVYLNFNIEKEDFGGSLTQPTGSLLVPIMAITSSLLHMMYTVRDVVRISWMTIQASVSTIRLVGTEHDHLECSVTYASYAAWIQTRQVVMNPGSV